MIVWVCQPPNGKDKIGNPIFLRQASQGPVLRLARAGYWLSNAEDVVD